MRILVTGATGFIGTHLVERLKKDHDVTCLVRKKPDIHGIKLHYGDIRKKDSLQGLKFDAVMHLAGILGASEVREEDYYLTHVLGTKNVVELCSGERFVHCSTAGVLGPVRNGSELTRLKPTNIYEKTKAQAEKIVLAYENHAIVRPEFVYGPGDTHVLQFFRAVASGRFPLIGGGQSMLHPTYVDDVVDCLIACLDKDIRNEVFMVAGERPVTVQELTQMTSMIIGRSMHNIRIPAALARMYVGIVPVLQRFGIDPVLTRSRLDFFTKDRTFDTSKAKEMLGYSPIGLEDGLRMTLAWYKGHGLI